MFRDMILKRCSSWYASDECTVKELISYIETKGAMRDAQVDAIKTYLFLKIACKNRPLPELFKSGAFNTIDLDNEELTASARDYLSSHTEAAAFYEFCKISQKDDKNIPKILKQIKSSPASLDYNRIFDDVFYNVDYTDYIFSLPMGAGKTFLMAAFIYLDLYLSTIEPDNPAFARNFIVLAPSGLKNSIIPSLKTISDFKPEWVIDEASAQRLRKEIVIETLDATTSEKKSNKVNNPNARKISLYLRGPDTQGLVFITNAEKVILERNLKGQATLLADGPSDRYLNELRALIGKIPRLSIFIDEVHHASSDSIKLRNVVSEWARNGSVATVLGFSGTPYLQKADKIDLVEKLKLTCSEINNVVQYYPLVEGIGNFLKTPEVTQFENRENYLEIVENGLRSFLENNSNFQYPNEFLSKVAVYCNSIQELEEEVYPVARRVAESYGLDSDKVVLRYHEDKPGFKLSSDAKMEFATLDSRESRIRIILLVQIGKEGWDCRSLSSVILAKENKSTRNMVLQTCCRCLRQVIKYDKEKAWIYLCKSNAQILEEQLKDEQHISLKEFQEGTKKEPKILRFYNRTNVIDLPPVDFYQFEMETNIITESSVDVDGNLRDIRLEDYRASRRFVVKDFSSNVIDTGIEDTEFGYEDMDVAGFGGWINSIAKGSYGFVKRSELYEHEDVLRQIYNAIVFEKDGVEYFSSRYDHAGIESKIRKSFYAERKDETRTDYIPESANLLCVMNLQKTKEVSDPERYTPSQNIVLKTIEEDRMGFEGREYMRRRYHYMPYHTDSGFENRILDTLHGLTERRFVNLEVYYNGDRFLSDFHIKCYERLGPRWRYIGRYTPDFLIVQRNDDGICKAIILETKGSIYSKDALFNEKKQFITDTFIHENNRRFGYPKFDYLYIQDDMPENEQLGLLENTIKSFFEVN